MTKPDLLPDDLNNKVCDTLRYIREQIGDDVFYALWNMWQDRTPNKSAEVDLDALKREIEEPEILKALRKNKDAGFSNAAMFANERDQLLSYIDQLATGKGSDNG